MVQEHQVHAHDLIFPLFLLENPTDRLEVGSMPGIYRLGIEGILAEIEACLKVGVRSFDIFPVVDEKHKDKQAIQH